jgi:multidrug efflux pump subunit AcrB
MASAGEQGAVTRFIRFLVERKLVINLVSIFLIAIGIYAAIAINREAFPNVNLDQIYIGVVYPGATPAEIEQLVITPIEQELKALNGVDRMLSIAYPGSGRIILELDPDATNRDRIVSDAQLAVDRANLPNDLPEEPSVVEIEGAVFPVMRLAISGPRSELELKRIGDRIVDELLEVQGVARVTTLGDRKEEIRITVDPARLAAQRISVGEIAAALSSWNVNAPGGDINTPTGQRQVRIVGEFRNARDAANLVLRANESGVGLRLRDVATVTESLEEPRIIYDVSGQPALSMLVLKKSDADIINTVERVDRYLATIPERYGADIRVKKFQDFSYFAKLRLGVLTSNGMVGVVLVFITLLLFLRPSVALTTTLGLPIIFLTGLFLLHWMGVTLNLISMFGFIMVLGMLVDDAIVIGENITYHMERGLAPPEAAVKGTTEMMTPVAATVMTTIVAFLPLAFMEGILGKFIWSIPVVVSLLLALSWLESFLMLPSHVAAFTNPHKHPPERTWLLRLERRYGWLLERAIRHRAITVTLALAAFIGSIALATTAMTFQLFPPVGVDQFFVRITAPPGTSLETMRHNLRAVDREVRARINPDYLEATVIATGEISQDEGDPLTQRGSRYGQIQAIYIPSAARPEHDALDDMRRLVSELPPLFPKLEFAFNELSGGPPVGRALEVEISGSDTAAAEAAARRLLDLLQGVRGVLSVDSGLKAGDEELHVVLNRALAAYVGVDLATAAQHVRAAVGGLVVSTSRRGTEEINLTIRYPKDGVNEVDALRTLLVPNQRGGLVPLARIAHFEEQPGLTTIRHKNGTRVMHVVADVDPTVITSLEINNLVAQRQAEWLGEAAGRVQVNYGGEAEKNVESFRGLLVSFLFAALGIFFILAIQFNNLGYPLIVMSAIPFGIIGVTLSFFVHDKLAGPMPLSFMSTLGTVALAGVVVNSAIVLLSFVQKLRAEGIEAHAAILQAGRRRLRAVIVTGATTIVGLLPTAYGWGGFDPFVAPMALALGWGLAFSTVITLFVVPAMLALAIDLRATAHRARRRWFGGRADGPPG